MSLKGDKKIMELYHAIFNWEFNYMHSLKKKNSAEFQSSVQLKKPWREPETKRDLS